MLRIVLFLAANIAIMLVINVVFSLFGLGDILDAQGVGLNLGILSVASAVMGMTGPFISRSDGPSAFGETHCRAASYRMTGDYDV